ncbi:MAG: hypothetical protein K8T26_09015 [Lentisphaerae bacterium]|nr:hypothetical protein [Lentisphaerota bacterium]
MKTLVAGLMFMAALNGLADDDRPVVQILGRTESDRPVTVVTPQAVQVQGGPTSAPKADMTVASAPAETGVLLAPIGAIVAWANVFTNMPPLPRGWVPCNGQPVMDTESPLHGQLVPNLNAAGGVEGRFLRGAPSSGMTGGSTTHAHEGYRSQKYGTQRSPVAAPVPANHLPPYYDVVWIMRIK